MASSDQYKQEPSDDDNNVNDNDSDSEDIILKRASSDQDEDKPPDDDNSDTDNDSEDYILTRAPSDQDEDEPPQDDNDNDNDNDNGNDDDNNNNNDNENDNDNNDADNADNIFEYRNKDHKRIVTGTQRKDMLAALEHVVTIGNYHRHRDWRINTEYKKRKLADAAAKDMVIGRTKTLRFGNQDEVLDVHAEDLRLYGRNGTEPPPWPLHPKNKSRERAVPDTMWEHEYGDMIHPCKFSARWLSAKPPLPEQPTAATATGTASAIAPAAGDQFRGYHDESSVSREEAPRALLLKCWERAVHAASNAIDVHPESTSPEEEEESDTDQSAAAGTQQDDSSSYSPAKAKEKCRQLQLVKLAATAPFTCPHCQIDCDATEGLEEHYYGQDNYRGCCWPLIENAQRALLARVLQGDVKSQTQSFLHLIVSKLKEPAETTGVKKGPKKVKSKKLFGWQDVSQLLEQSLAGSIKQTPCTVNTDNVMQQTLLVDLEKTPVLLNERTVEAITSRLHHRYAKVPK